MRRAGQCSVSRDGPSTRDGARHVAASTTPTVGGSLTGQQAAISSAAAQQTAADCKWDEPTNSSEQQRAAALGAQQPARPLPLLHTGLLLELPDPALEAAFWCDEDIGRWG